MRARSHTYARRPSSPDFDGSEEPWDADVAGGYYPGALLLSHIQNVTLNFTAKLPNGAPSSYIATFSDAFINAHENSYVFPWGPEEPQEMLTVIAPFPESPTLSLRMGGQLTLGIAGRVVEWRATADEAGWELSRWDLVLDNLNTPTRSYAHLYNITAAPAPATPQSAAQQNAPPEWDFWCPLAPPSGMPSNANLVNVLTCALPRDVSALLRAYQFILARAQGLVDSDVALPAIDAVWPTPDPHVRIGIEFEILLDTSGPNGARHRTGRRFIARTPPPHIPPELHMHERWETQFALSSRYRQGNTPTTVGHTIAVWALIFNTAPYLPQWLSHYRSMGVQHFYLYDHMSTDNTAAALIPYVLAGIVTLTRVNLTLPDECVQQSWGVVQDLVANQYLRKYGRLNEWTGGFDVDEYATVRPDPNTTVLQHEDADEGVVDDEYRNFYDLLRRYNVTGGGSAGAGPPDFGAFRFASRTFLYFGGIYTFPAPDTLARVANVPPRVRGATAPSPVHHAVLSQKYPYYFINPDWTYSKLLFMTSRMPYHGHIHIMVSGDTRMAQLPFEVGLINHYKVTRGGTQGPQDPGVLYDNYTITAIARRVVEQLAWDEEGFRSRGWVAAIPLQRGMLPNATTAGLEWADTLGGIRHGADHVLTEPLAGVAIHWRNASLHESARQKGCHRGYLLV